MKCGIVAERWMGWDGLGWNLGHALATLRQRSSTAAAVAFVANYYSNENAQRASEFLNIPASTLPIHCFIIILDD